MSLQGVESLTADAVEAGTYVRNLVKHRAREGGIRKAIAWVGNQAKIGTSAAWGFYHGKRKTARRSEFARLRHLYLTICEQEIERLSHELAIERAKGRGDAVFEDIAAKVSALALEVKEAQRP